MIQAQVLNYILANKDFSIINDNNINVEYFPNYIKEFEYIKSHISNYGNVPDKATFIARFKEFPFTEVNETKEFLIDTLQEEYTYNKVFPIFKQATELLSGQDSDSRRAVSYLQEHLLGIETNSDITAIDLVENADVRLKEFIDRVENPTKYYLSTGFQELDEVIGGWDRKEEFGVVTARPGVGKSFVLDTFALHSLRLGLRVGLYSGEMTDSKVGYRLDTLFSNISNTSILKGHREVVDKYKKAIENFKAMQGHFFVVTPKMLGGDFANADKLKSFCDKYKLDILYIDQMSLLNGTTTKMKQNSNEQYASIVREVKRLQTIVQIPIIVANQLNRPTDKEEADPTTSRLAGSDRISQDPTIIISLQRKANNLLEMQIIKNRDGKVGNKLTYNWDADKGIYTFIPTENDATNGSHIEDIKNQYKRKPTTNGGDNTVQLEEDVF